jgi:RNA polymerase sigma-70 factor (ECF subfamily)
VWKLNNLSIKPDIREEELARRAQKGDRAAFDSLVGYCAPRLFNLAYRLMGNRDDADDITQEAFLRIYQALPRFKWDASFNSWMYKIISNLCFDEMKRRKKRPLNFAEITAEGENEPEFTAENSDPADRIIKSTESKIVQQAINELPAEARAIIVMFDVQGMSYLEIADIMKLNMGTVKSRLNRVRHTLREKIDKMRGTL